MANWIKTDSGDAINLDNFDAIRVDQHGWIYASAGSNEFLIKSTSSYSQAKKFIDKLTNTLNPARIEKEE